MLGPPQQAKRKDRMEKCIGAIIMVTFLFLPSSSFVIFQSFSCGDTGQLNADQTISCDSPEYNSIIALAAFMLLVWPIGVPVMYLWLLGHHYGSTKAEYKSILHDFFSGKQFTRAGTDALINVDEEKENQLRLKELDRTAPKYLSALNAEYETQYWWVPVFEQYRKLFITGATILFGQGSLDQLIAGILIAMVSALVYFAISPYKDFNDDLFSMFTNFQVFMVLLWSTLVKVQKLLEDAGVEGTSGLNSEVLGWLLILSNVSVMLILSLFLLAEVKAVKTSVKARGKWDQIRKKGFNADVVLSRMKGFSKDEGQKQGSFDFSNAVGVEKEGMFDGVLPGDNRKVGKEKKKQSMFEGVVGVGHNLVMKDNPMHDKTPPPPPRDGDENSGL